MEDDSIIKYDLQYIPGPFGFRNVGSTCYFNALFQSLLSCSSITETLIKNKNNPLYHKNKISRIYLETINMFLKYKTDKSLKYDLLHFSPTLWTVMINLSRKRKDNIPFTSGQQCAREGLYLLLNAMENLHSIQRLFLHRYKSRLYCPECTSWSSEIEKTHIMFDVQPNLKTEQSVLFSKIDPNYNKTLNMNEYLFRRTSYVDNDHICSSCKKRCEKYKVTSLVMIPEILVVLSKKYSIDGKRKLNIKTEFPEKLVFNGVSDSEPVYLNYEAVAQIEHIGGLNSGHYWAICKRDDGWYNINDSITTKSRFCPTINTYMVFYHYI